MNHRSRIRTAVIAFPVLLLCPSLSPQQVQSVAHVLEVKGDWRLIGSAAGLTAGSALAAGSRVQSASAHTGSSITIVQDANLSRTRVVCDSTPADPCLNPVVVSAQAVAPANQTSQLKSIVQAAFAVLLSNPPAVESHYALTLSRGVEPDRESENVVAFDKHGNVQLPAAVPPMPPGTYSVSISPASVVGPEAEQAVTLGRDGRWTPLHLSKPGTYRFTITDDEGHQLRDMLLLAVPPAALESQGERLGEMKGAIATWQGPHARSDGHLFLRTFLIAEGNRL